MDVKLEFNDFLENMAKEEQEDESDHPTPIQVGIEPENDIFLDWDF
jgi:hypothetical protein